MSDFKKMTIPQLQQAMMKVAKQLPVPNTVREEVAERLTRELLTDPDSRTTRGPISKSLTERGAYYVVPGDDLNFAETAVGIAAGVAAVLKDPVSLLSSLCLLLLQFRRKAVKLNQNEGMVVHTLIDRRYRDGGLTAAELTKNLRDHKLTLSESDVEAILQRLQNKRRRGEHTPVVHEYNGKWHANEIWRAP
jgi:hypothetical protein